MHSARSNHHPKVKSILYSFFLDYFLVYPSGFLYETSTFPNNIQKSTFQHHVLKLIFSLRTISYCNQKVATYSRGAYSVAHKDIHLKTMIWIKSDYEAPPVFHLSILLFKTISQVYLYWVEQHCPRRPKQQPFSPSSVSPPSGLAFQELLLSITLLMWRPLSPSRSK